MQYYFLIAVLLVINFTACGQLGSERPTDYTLVGGPCEGCEAVLEYPKKQLRAVDTLPDFHTECRSLKISGTIYEADGVSPAEDVILYVYHTNEEGIYPTKGGEKGWAKRHGFIRTWLQTDKKGSYTFYTCMPGTYPSRNTPAHIHATLLEPNGDYYYIADYFFEGDTLLTKDHLPQDPRGGDQAILKLTKQNGLFVGKRDIILGKHVPGHPQ